ncbi:hypothetical protein GF351_02140 [Candidatus Woesearchaeota archaeon]|nr:hypothetical protein [Candidatus Woesearchaeota archaeon]
MMVLNSFAYKKVLGLPIVDWGGIATFLLLAATFYTGYVRYPGDLHLMFAVITVVFGIFHGTFGLLTRF